MYREVFEKYYPGQSQMIVGFWMPNKEWEGCDVDDPSQGCWQTTGPAECKTCRSPFRDQKYEYQYEYQKQPPDLWIFQSIDWGL